MRSYDVVYEGVIPNLQRRYEATSSDYVREELERYMAERPCPACNGARLKPEVLGVTVGERSIVDVARMPIREAQDWFAVLARDPGEDPTAPLTEREFLIARQIFKEIRERLGFLVDVGLDYLTLERSANTLSGGEAQRIRLATQIGSSSDGRALHPRRAEHRTPPARQRAADPHPGATARHRQHLDRRRARRGDDARRRLDRRHRSGRRSAWRAYRRRRLDGRHHRTPRSRSPASTCPASGRSRCRTRGAPATARRSSCAARARTTCAM